MLPLDHYTLLEIDPASTPREIESAYRAAMVKRPERSVLEQSIDWLFGRDDTRLQEARDELLDADRRARYDAHLESLATFFRSPPP